MATIRQIEANRANAQLSTGPRTPEGKARVAGNRRLHGLAGRHVILPGERQEEYDTLLAALIDDFSPSSAFEEILVHQMAQAHWKLRRIAEQEAAFLAKHPNPFLDDNPEPARKLAQLARYEASARRAFHQAAEQLRRIAKARPAAVAPVDTQFDDSNPMPPPGDISAAQLMEQIELAVNVREAEIAALEWIGEPGVINAHQP